MVDPSFHLKTFTTRDGYILSKSSGGGRSYSRSTGHYRQKSAMSSNIAML